MPITIPRCPTGMKTSGAKPQADFRGVRGPFGRLRAGSEGPLFHGDADICDFSASCEAVPYPKLSCETRSGEALTTVISPDGHRTLPCLSNLPKGGVRLTGGIRFVNFNSPFTVYLPNQVPQHESVAANLDFGVPGSVWLEVPACS